MNSTKNIRLPIYIGILVVLLLIAVRFGLYFLKTDGFSGLSLLLPALLVAIFLFAFGTSAFLAAWVYQDCKKRGDDPILWAIIVFAATPFIGLLIYFLRRSEIKRDCPSCGHQISLRAKYCEECGMHVEKKEDITIMTKQKTHHLSLIAAGGICMALMLACLTGFIVSAAGSGVNKDPASNERVWNLGAISMIYNTCIDGVWKLNFKSASNGFIEQENMTVQNADTQTLYADVSCGAVPDGATLVLWVVQGELSQSVDVTNLTEPLEYPLNEFENGKIYVRLQINGVEDTVSEIYIK